jgi:hypothetical protein
MLLQQEKHLKRSQQANQVAIETWIFWNFAPPEPNIFQYSDIERQAKADTAGH